jgi:hypothetical protein
MFLIFHGNLLIGSSELELGDPPMGVAFGKFEPNDNFALLRPEMMQAHDGAGNELQGIRYLEGLSAKTAEGIVIVCSGVAIFEYSDAEDFLQWEVSCLGIGYPLYAELFPHHVKAYDDQFKE